MGSWHKKNTITEIKSKWLSLFCEEWVDERGVNLEYWRVEKENSLIVVTVYRDNFVLPQRQFRPGINRETLDFPGGRFNKEEIALDKAKQIIENELNINQNNILTAHKISENPLFINSSFSNQELHVFAAEVDLSGTNNIIYPIRNWNTLLKEFQCLQCNIALRMYLADNMQSERK